jgi:hypothetical protein
MRLIQWLQWLTDSVEIEIPTMNLKDLLERTHVSQGVL